MATTMKSIKKQKKDADKKSITAHRARLKDIGTTHGSIANHLKSLNTGTNTDYNQARSNTAAATAVLKSRLAEDAGVTRAGATGEQDRLGLGSVGMGSFDNVSSQSQDIASQSGTDFLSNLRNEQVNALAYSKGQIAANVGQKASAVESSRNRYYDEEDANEEAYKKMVTQFKEQEAARKAAEARYAAQQRAYSSRGYGGYGGYSRGYSNYGSGGGAAAAPASGIRNGKIGKFNVPKPGWAPNWNAAPKQNMFQKTSDWGKFMARVTSDKRWTVNSPRRSLSRN